MHASSLAVLKIALCCCRLCGCHGRGMWATRQLRSALQNRPKICYSNTDFPLREGRGNGWMDGWRRNVILTKLGLLYPVVRTVFTPPLPLFLPFLLFLPHLDLSCSFTNTWAPDDWLHGYDCSGFTSGADDSDNNYFIPKYITVTFLRVMSNHLWIRNIRGMLIMARWRNNRCKALQKA